MILLILSEELPDELIGELTSRGKIFPIQLGTDFRKGCFFIPTESMLPSDVLELFEEKAGGPVSCLICEIKDYYGRWDRSLWRFLEEGR